MQGPRRPAVFLDRDGTLNVEKNYLFRVDEFQWIDGAPEAVRHLNEMGFWVIVITNQAGIARGYYTKADMDKLHAHMTQELAKAGAHIDGFYFCPHHPDYGAVRDCDCRKPKTGLIAHALQDFDVDLRQTYLIGDRLHDVETAEAAGVKPILVKTGYGAESASRIEDPAVIVVQDLKAAQEFIEKESKAQRPKK